MGMGGLEVGGWFRSSMGMRVGMEEVGMLRLIGSLG